MAAGNLLRLSLPAGDKPLGVGMLSLLDATLASAEYRKSVADNVDRSGKLEDHAQWPLYRVFLRPRSYIAAFFALLTELMQHGSRRLR